MTSPPPFVVAALPRKRSRAVWVGSIITSVFVTAGAALATWTLPAVPTPGNVARAFLEADNAHDWPTIWALMCSRTRSEIGDYSAFTQGLAYLDYYDDGYSESDPVITIEIDDVRGVRAPSGPAVAVAVTMSSGERNSPSWESSGELLVVEEDGELRVCDRGPWKDW